ncbi:Uncharacterised protein [Segatella copri]|nr:Uncharacterised protein [Segatella copri]
MSDCLLITLALLHRDITTRLANLWQHIGRNPVLELHGSRKLRAENQSIETALVDIEHQSTTHRRGSILLQTGCYPCTAFRRIKWFN